ncbi:hypothetical protein ACNJX9_35480 [Bradyrhizobium sp. DASA03076]|uniref:hypothetical protein n=1 Tax=Bradyrhizobium sp. BLXBL-03 TaxID=3395916 RepID=UPI003F6F0F02
MHDHAARSKKSASNAEGQFEADVPLQVALDDTDAMIAVNDDELRGEYLKGGCEGRKDSAAEIPAG